uniref:Uncharacterized protein n=1 Tax=Anguilla anguilla TaxID=7936 RepID=A0A0E9R4S7_ANGAN
MCKLIIRRGNSPLQSAILLHSVNSLVNLEVVSLYSIPSQQAA